MKTKRINPEDIQLISETVIRLLKKELDIKQSCKWITSKDVSKLLGVSNSKLQKMRQQNLITYSSFGRNIYYDTEEIMQILEQNKVDKILQ